MSSVLRLSGVLLDVDALLASTTLQPLAVFRKGEPRFSRRLDGPRHAASGVNFAVSAAEMGDFSSQLQETLAFVKSHAKSLRQLTAFPGVESAAIDFGAEIHPPQWCSFTFPPELLAAMGACGIELELSVYPVDDDQDP